MDELKQILAELKNMGCCGIKVSFEDEGALYNEIISMRSLTKDVGLDLSVKIGGCEAKRDITDCIDLNCDTIVAPMVESKFALNKFLKSLACYNYDKKLNPPAWTGLPSATPVPDPIDSKDFYVLFPRQTILPDESQY